MAKDNVASRTALINGPDRASNTADDVLTLDWSGYAEGYGFNTYNFAVDATGGWKGYFYLDGTTRLDFTSIERFNIIGTSYDDIIRTGDGIDVINAGGGNDIIYSGLGRDVLDGGSGIDGISRNLINANAAISINLRDDTVSTAYGSIANFEYFADFNGTARNDTFVSSTKRGNDVVNAGDGNDRGEFMRGNDTFTGGGGSDTVKGDFSWSDIGRGIDTSISAESSGEGFRGYFYLDPANRLTFNAVENFEVIGTKYADTITTAAGNDIVSAGAGDDLVRSGAGNDTLDGGDGLDGVQHDFALATGDVAIDLAAGTVTGTATSIVNFEYFLGVTGSLFNDTFRTTTLAVRDSVTAGGGDDTAVFYNGDDIFAGGLGTDRLIVDYSGSAANAGIQMSFNVDANGGYSGYYYVNGALRADFTSTEAFTITGTSVDDTIFAGDGNDVVNAGAGYDIVRTGGGDDVLDGGAGLDGLGRNFITSTANIGINLLTDAVTGTGGSMTNFEYFSQMVTGQGNDRLVSTRALLNDTVSTGGGNDFFTAYGGYDTFTAGLGTDRLIIDWSRLELGVGINQISQNVDVNGGYAGYFYISPQARVDYTSVEAFDITGTKYNDQMRSRNGNDVLKGGAGNDTLDAGRGNDVLNGGDGIDGFAKDFTNINQAMTIDLTTSTITGATTTITDLEYLLDVRTGNGADTFMTLAAQYNDVAWGGGGADIAYFFSGEDRFEAGSARDTLVIDYSALETENGISSSISEDTSNGGFRGYFYVEGGNRTDFTGVEVMQVTGTKNNDSISGGGGADRFDGGDGRDTLRGGDGNDILDGGLAGDTLDGGAGTDTLTGGRGSDTLTGGTGSDKFVFAQNDVGNGTVYVDRITDFNRTADADIIDVSRIDADAGVAGNQAFTFIDTAPFTGAGQLRLVTIGGLRYLQGNTNADLAPDFAIRVDGEVPIATDFVL